MDYNNLSNEKPAAFPNRPLGTFRRISLGVKLPMIVIALATVAFLISTFLSVQTSETALIGHLQEALAAQAISQADLIRSHLIWTRSMAVDLAAQAATVDSNESDQLKVIDMEVDMVMLILVPSPKKVKIPYPPVPPPPPPAPLTL